MEIEKVVAGLYRNARMLVGTNINVRKQGEEKTTEMRATDVRFIRKPVVTDTEVSLKFRVRFKGNVHSDITFKTQLPKA